MLPQYVVLDIDLVCSAPKRMNRSGVGDVLSCHTGLWDWRFAVDRGEGVPWDAAAASLGRQLLVELAERESRSTPSHRRGALAGIRVPADRQRVQRARPFAVRGGSSISSRTRMNTERTRIRCMANWSRCVWWR